MSITGLNYEFKAYLLWGFLVEESSCSYCEFEICILCPRNTQQRDQIFKQLDDISVPFRINYFLYGSPDFSYNLNCDFLCVELY